MENLNNFKTINNENQGNIYCLQPLYDGRLAAGNSESNLNIYDMEIFIPNFIINNNLGNLSKFIQLRNKKNSMFFWLLFYT